MTIKYKLGIITALLCLVGFKAFGQNGLNLPMNQSFQHLDRFLYHSVNRFHTSIKPYLKNQTDTIASIDSLYNINTKRTLFNHILNKNLIDFKFKELYFTINPVVNFEYGRNKDYENASWVNSRGVLINGSIGNKVAFSTTLSENQAVYNDFRYEVIQKLTQQVIPGQGLAKPYKEEAHGYDYYFSEAYISYTPSPYFNFQIGTGKHFFGDGYRSLLLSDNSFSYPYFKITTDVWHIKYINLWTQFQHLRDRMPDVVANTKKWGAFQYLSWNATKWLNISLFEAVIWKDRDTLGYRGFDVHYANPVIYLRPVEWAVGSPDNVIVGVSGKITVAKKTALYGQLVLDEFKLSELKARNGWWANKWGVQAGLKTFDLFSIKNLDFQSEINLVRPFMYSHSDPISNYAHFNQPLAHPMGSNFGELVSFLRYKYRRISVELGVIYAQHGADSAGMNYGNDIFQSYSTVAQEYDNRFFQVEKNEFYNLKGTISYLVNPKYNLNLFLGVQSRTNSNSASSKTQNLILFGMRTSLQNFYWDF